MLRSKREKKYFDTDLKRKKKLTNAISECWELETKRESYVDSTTNERKHIFVPIIWEIPVSTIENGCFVIQEHRGFKEKYFEKRRWYG